MNSVRPILYTKLDCPWSDDVRAVLDRRGIAYDERIVTTDPVLCLEMMRVSGQTKAPVVGVVRPSARRCRARGG